MNSTMYRTAQSRLTKAAPGIVLLRVPSISDLDTCDQFDLAINRAIASGPRLVVLDLSDVDSISTVMLGLLLKLRRSLVPTGAQVRLAGVQPMVRGVLNTCRLDQLFAVFSTPEEAMNEVVPCA
jgi:anti-anti-sigma factor